MLRSDSILYEDVAAELAADSFCREAQIVVAVKNGVVTLSGTVPDPALKLAAVRAVRRVFGVDGIDPRLEVGTPPTATASTTADLSA